MVFLHTSQISPFWRKALLNRRLTLTLGFLLAVAIPLQGATGSTNDIWLFVNTDELNLAIMQGDNEVLIFENIAIGSNGPALRRSRGDKTTPLGEFTITEIRRSKRFELFMAFNYPNLEHTERAFDEDRIGPDIYRVLRRELDQGNPPSQATILGGQLGIHGLGEGSVKIHQSVNWTDGCIALTNEQVAELASWIDVGTRVVVR